jgi:hypothetical protein
MFTYTQVHYDEALIHYFCFHTHIHYTESRQIKPRIAAILVDVASINCVSML